MGSCFSDVRGGQEGVGGGVAQGRLAGPAAAGPTSQTETNAAVDHFFNSRGMRGLYIPLELSLSASKLQDMDVFSKSDPMAVLYVKKQDGKLEEVGRTEVIQNSLNPAWITKIIINYQFEMVQNLVFRVFDIDTNFHNTPVKSLKLDDQDYLGEASCALSEIVTKQDRSVTLKLQKGPGTGHSGSLMVHAEETVASKQAVELILRCTRLENKDTFSKSDPFIRISRRVESGALIPICKTEVLTNNLNPVWRPITLTTPQFNSKENPLMIECFDFESNGSHKLLGIIDVSVAELERLHRDRTGTSFYVNRHGHRKVLEGQLFVDKFEEKMQYSFLDYISGGFELNFMVAIDFTASNGDPRMPQSLHYVDPAGRLNSYQQGYLGKLNRQQYKLHNYAQLRILLLLISQRWPVGANVGKIMPYVYIAGPEVANLACFHEMAIIGVGEVLQFYDTDKRFPAWGFGGRTPNGSVSHCFNLNLLPMETEVVGLEGIMGAYSTALHSVALAGPTLFGPVINRAAEIATHSLSSSQNKYFILLIITDGVINDPKETKDAIVRASDLPLSILIVGVGSADFKEMEILDADGGKRLESSTGRIATRDIVQFVPMRDFLGGQVSIVQALLEELPGQFLSYVRSRDIKPLFAQQYS